MSVDVEHPAEVGGVELERVPAMVDPRAVDAHVEAAQPVARLPDDGLHPLGVRDVEREDERAAAQAIADLRGHALRAGRVEVADGDIGAEAGEPPRDLAAEPGRPAGHERGTAVQVEAPAQPRRLGKVRLGSGARGFGRGHWRSDTVTPPSARLKRPVRGDGAGGSARRGAVSRVSRAHTAVTRPVSTR